MLGGYGETTFNIGSSEIEYLPYSVFSTWLDISGKFAKGEWGIFGGYTDNLGLSEPFDGATYTSVVILITFGGFHLASHGYPEKQKLDLELETTAAIYGILEVGDKEVNSKGLIRYIISEDYCLECTHFSMTKFNLNQGLSVCYFITSLMIIGGNSVSAQDVEEKPRYHFLGT